MEIKGLVYIFVAAFLFLCIFSFHPDDPTLNQAVSATWKTSNMAGTVGSYIAGFLVELFGVGAIAWPLLLAYLGLVQFSDRLRLPMYRWFGVTTFILCLMAWVTGPWAKPASNIKPALTAGGLIGKYLAGTSLALLSPWGAVLFWLFFTVASVQV
ncbi:MAG: DNA translocase FtsK 4TM domain-containing protein, partial [Humidesulfovibrio sp.]|nr:DNA translocase FtsK 4TM domain-containing protein [Humidesulfovibrio sp.]